MPRSTINFDTVRNIGLTLPGVEESRAYGVLALKVRGKLLACVPANRSAEPASLVVCVDFDDRAELLAANPDFYYVTDDYVGYNAVLVRLFNPDSAALPCWRTGRGFAGHKLVGYPERLPQHNGIALLLAHLTLVGDSGESLLM